jgi:hypothetical protein
VFKNSAYLTDNVFCLHYNVNRSLVLREIIADLCVNHTKYTVTFYGRNSGVFFVLNMAVDVETTKIKRFLILISSSWFHKRSFINSAFFGDVTVHF